MILEKENFCKIATYSMWWYKMNKSNTETYQEQRKSNP